MLPAARFWNARITSRSTVPTRYARSGVGIGGTVQFIVIGTSRNRPSGFRKCVGTEMPSSNCIARR